MHRSAPPRTASKRHGFEGVINWLTSRSATAHASSNSSMTDSIIGGGRQHSGPFLVS